MFRKIFYIFILLHISFFTFGQSKTVKMFLDSTKIYLRYFYKNYKSDYILNDSVTYLCRKINQEKFYLDRLVYKKKKWTKTYRIEVAKDSLRVTTRLGGIRKGKKFIYSKEKYYNSFEITEIKK